MVIYIKIYEAIPIFLLFSVQNSYFFPIFWDCEKFLFSYFLDPSCYLTPWATGTLCFGLWLTLSICFKARVDAPKLVLFSCFHIIFPRVNSNNKLLHYYILLCIITNMVNLLGHKPATSSMPSDSATTVPLWPLDSKSYCDSKCLDPFPLNGSENDIPCSLMFDCQ